MAHSRGWCLRIFPFKLIAHNDYDEGLDIRSAIEFWEVEVFLQLGRCVPEQGIYGLFAAFWGVLPSAKWSCRNSLTLIDSRFVWFEWD